jgi:hypothetical protein
MLTTVTVLFTYTQSKERNKENSLFYDFVKKDSIIIGGGGGGGGGWGGGFKF